MATILTILLILTVFVTTVLAVYRWLSNHFSTLRMLGIPGPRPTFVFGNIREILTKGSFQALLDWHTEFGDTFGYYEGHTPIVVVTDADMIKQILVKDFFDYFPNRKPYPMAPRKTHALFLARGGKWKRIRNILTPAFSSAKMKQMSPIINNAVSEMVENMEQHHKSGEPYDIFEHFQRLTLDVIGRSALGLNFTCQRNPTDPYLRNIRNLFEGLAKSKLLPFLMVFPFLCHLLVGVKNLVSLIGLNPVRFLIQGMTEVIQERKSRKTKTGYVDLIELMLHSEVTTTSTTDFVQSSRSQHDASSQRDSCNSSAPETLNRYWKRVHCEGLTEAEIISQSIVFLLAGYETTSTTLAFAAYALVTNPDVQERICAEIDREISPETEINFDTVQQLPYMEMFFNEVCRKYPTAGLWGRAGPTVSYIGYTAPTGLSKLVPAMWEELCQCMALQRVCTRQAVRDWTYRGLRIPAGMAVRVNVWGVHHNPDYWPEPERFDPERFSPERKGSIKPFTYLPFGEGPRNCIGMRFAVMEAKIALVRILQKFSLHPCSETKIPVEYKAQGAINPKHGVVVGLRKRIPTP